MVPSKGKRIAGWILSGIVAAFLIGASGVPKFIDFPGKTEMFEKMGFTVQLMYKIGALEVAIAILYLIPRTAFVATILLTAYLVSGRRRGDSRARRRCVPVSGADRSSSLDWLRTANSHDILAELGQTGLTARHVIVS